ncbi:MAG TPA: ABC transporter permease [archaeon]|nr:ABC transporter permease [archaeon]
MESNLLKSLGRHVAGIASIILGITAWQALLSFGLVNANFLPTPLDVFKSLVELIQDGTFIGDIFSSITRVFLGFLGGAIIGLIIAALNAYSGISTRITTPWIEIIRPIPPLAWIPIAILFFGLGDKPAIFLVSLGSFFPIYTNTYQAIKNIPDKYLHTAKVLGANTKLLLLDIIIPSILPRVITGLKIGLGISWMIVITAELVGATSGLGYFIELNRLLLRVDNVIVGMLVIGAIGYAMNTLISFVEKRFFHYQVAV